MVGFGYCEFSVSNDRFWEILRLAAGSTTSTEMRPAVLVAVAFLVQDTVISLAIPAARSLFGGGRGVHVGRREEEGAGPGRMASASLMLRRRTSFRPV